jgi:hypothetical protein
MNRGSEAAATVSSSEASQPSRASDDGLQELLERTLWPMVEAAFRDVEEHVEARFFQLGELQVVISRGPARGAVHRGAGRPVRLELWPSAGPRVLVVDWSGRRPYVVHRRDGDLLQRLIQTSRQSGSVE